MSWFLQLSVALAVLVLFGTSAFVAHDSRWIEVSGDGFSGVIVTPDDADGFRTGAESYWMPSEGDVHAAETALEQDQGMLEQRRQYGGIMEDGQRKIYINGFCNDQGLDWRTQIVLVDDGGDCYFAAKYNVDRHELESFSFNGEA